MIKESNKNIILLLTLFGCLLSNCDGDDNQMPLPTETAFIYGNIYDQNENALPKANIVAKFLDNQFSDLFFGSATGPNGEYMLTVRMPRDTMQVQIRISYGQYFIPDTLIQTLVQSDSTKLNHTLMFR